MDDIFVGQLMSDDLYTATKDTLVEDAAETMLSNGVSSLVVVDDESHLEGILTTTDFVDIVAKSKPKAETTVERYMTTDVRTAAVGDSIQDVADAMMEHGFHHMPVVDSEDGTVVGLISTADLTAYISTVQTPSPA
jgi:CBS domain-containing protein